MQILNDVSKVEALVKIKDIITNDTVTFKQNIKDELFTLDKLGRKCVVDEITGSKAVIIENIIDELGKDVFKGSTLRVAQDIKDELGTEEMNKKQENF